MRQFITRVSNKHLVLLKVGRCVEDKICRAATTFVHHDQRANHLLAVLDCKKGERWVKVTELTCVISRGDGFALFEK